MKKMKVLDLSVSLLFVASLIVIYFFWGCHLDLYVTVLAALIIAVTGLTAYLQYKKMKELGADEQENSKAI